MSGRFKEVFDGVTVYIICGLIGYGVYVNMELSELRLKLEVSQAKISGIAEKIDRVENKLDMLIRREMDQ